MALALLVMTGRVTMVGLSRWAGPGGSSRTVQRFVATAIPWATLFGGFFRHQGYRSEEVSLLVGDEVVVTKAGKRPYGLDRFFASLYGKPVPGLACFALSRVRVQARRAWPMRVEQVVRSDAEQAASKAKAAAKKPPSPCAPRRPGRPKGRKNTSQTDGTFTPEFVRMTGWLDALLTLIAGVGSLTSLGLDGHCGNHHAVQRARPRNLHLMSTLRGDAARSFPSTGPEAGRGPRRQYGAKVDDAHRPEKSLLATTVEGPLHPCVYQAQRLHKACTPPCNVVILVKTTLPTQAQAHVLRFSRALTLAAASLVDSYGLRGHSAWNFRDAKQYWGLEDFMKATPTGVTNAANLSVFMVNVAYRLCADVRQRAPDSSVLDLQADCRGDKYVEETIQMLPAKPEPIVFAKILNQVAGLGRIHAAQSSFSFS